ncbi:MAG TPA: hypothetical protein H9841_03655 [Candidatus Flavonifractor merdigallinarum]|uniref:Uncharacterized protein n=1 Tax=Candidatus Flavonifractor merdigallinarum TaxID=2838589 RepID=A0A9D1Y8I2_9FIRM|nr:hypothetical protein [Candidatus Flavonifractor merdigallinarum]
MNQNQILQKGLEQLFLAEALTVAVGVGSLLPLGDLLLSGMSLLSIVALVLMLMGLHTLHILSPRYRLAFQLSLVELGVAFAGGIVTAALGLYVSVAHMMTALTVIAMGALVLEGLVVFFSCGATMELIRPIAEHTAEQGTLVRMLVPLVLAVGLVGQGLYLLPVPGGIPDFLTLLASVLQIACNACFVRFLYQCRKVVAPAAH